MGEEHPTSPILSTMSISTQNDSICDTLKSLSKLNIITDDEGSDKNKTKKYTKKLNNNYSEGDHEHLKVTNYLNNSNKSSNNLNVVAGASVTSRPSYIKYTSYIKYNY